MASTDARPVPQKNVAYRITFPIFDADGDLVTGATGLDSEVSKDGGTFADCTNEATEIATSSGMYYLDLTSTEMNADTVAIIIKTSTSGAKTTPVVLYPEEAGDIRVNVTQFGGTNGTFASGRPEVNTTHAAGTAWASGAITAAVFAADAITAAKVAADVGTEIGTAVWATTTRLLTAGTNIVLAKGTGVTGFNDLDAAGIRGAVGLASANLDSQLSTLATAANLATVAGYLDTEIAAILADTNELQLDWTAGGRLDLVLAARSSQSSVDDLPTNAELTAALAGVATASDLATVSGNVDAIKDKTDDLTFTVTGVLDANIRYVNDTEVTGNGQTGTEWGPA